MILLVLLFAAFLWYGYSTSKTDRKLVEKPTASIRPITGTEAEASAEPVVTYQPEYDPSIKNLKFRAKPNREKQTATVRWRAIPNASRYVIYFYTGKSDKWNRIAKTTVYPAEKM